MPDNHPDSMKGYFCSEIVSSAYNATWKVRYKSGGIGQVWKRVGNEWSPWVNLPWISPDAEKFAATRTPKVQVTVGAGTPTPTMPGTTEEPPASSPPQAGNPVVDAAKKAVDDLLKRLGK